MRIDQALREMDKAFAPQVHRGGLSSREGLVALMHDGYGQGRQDVPAIEDKRLCVAESEFANVLYQGRRDGNTLSAALRDCWDDVDLKAATKSNRLYASDPHVCLSGAISPGDLTGLMSARELTNGFANRFLMIWAERTRMLPFLKETPQGQISAECFKGKVPKARLDASLEHLLASTPPKIIVQWAELPHRHAGYANAGVSACVGRKLISLVSPSSLRRGE
jgi:putative DNA primase/helicase